MNCKWIMSAAILSLFAAMPVYAQDQGTEKPQDTKPAQTQDKAQKPTDTTKAPKQQAAKDQQKQEEKTAKQQQQTQKDQQAQATKEQQQTKDEQKQGEKTAKQEQQTQKQQEQAAKQQKDQEKVQKSVAKQQQQEEKQQKLQQQQVARQQAQQNNNQRQQAASQQAENGGRGIHIPDDRFREHFGREHHFHVERAGGGNQFVYGGYTFEFVDAWPAGWAYTDDCYIDYIDGEYFLFDLLHPGVRIVVIVVG